MCNLRCVCIVLGAFLIGYNALAVYLTTKFSVPNGVIIGVGLVGALALLFGAILEDERVMLVAFIVNLIAIIPSLIILLFVIFNLGDVRDYLPESKSVNSIVAHMVVEIVFRLFPTCVAYAYYTQLQDSEDE